MKRIVIILCLWLLQNVWAQPPKVLVVNAHPDDESGCAATIYKITHELGGVVDLVVITNGEAGYKYSLLAENIYKQPLTREAIGRKYLPRIRKKELRAGCNWVGIRDIIHFNQLDTHYTLDADTVLTAVWDVENIRKKLIKRIQKEQYDYLFCLLPTEETHGHHKAATILALETVQMLPQNRPIVLGVSVSGKEDTLIKTFKGLEKYTITSLRKNPTSSFQVDRTTSFGYKNRLNYQIVVNWLIAEHKSQGTMQTYMNQGDFENFWYFDLNTPERKKETADFFDKLSRATLVK